MDIHLSAPGIEAEIDVHLARRAERWVAVATHRGERSIGIAPTPHGALAASISFLGAASAAALLADPRLMAASATVR
jgi:hypothetical protein